MRSEFSREQEEITNAAADLGCDASAIQRCPECRKLLRGDRAIIATDGAKLCGEFCRAAWNKRANPAPSLVHFLKNDFLSFSETQSATKPRTHEYYSYGVTLLLNSDLAKLRLDEVTSQHVTQFTAGMSRLSPSTINNALRTLRRALNLAEEWGKITRAPKVSLAKGERQRDRVITDGEFALYIELCPQPWRDLALLIRYEGLRPGEAYALRWENIIFLSEQVGLILISGGKSKAARRQLPIAPEIYPALKAQHLAQGRPQIGWVFPAATRSGHIEQGSAKNQHFKASEIVKKLCAAHELWKRNGGKGKWAKELAVQTCLGAEFIERHADAIRSGLKRFEPYCLRHTALTRLAEAGCDTFTLAKIAGHSSISITQRYVHPQADAIERAFGKLHEIPRLAS